MESNPYNNSYFDFENKFRGESSKISDIFEIYDSLINVTLEGMTSPSLLDIGCGRGELLKKFKNKFSESMGIESDFSMIQHCRDNGLNVIEGDAIDKLSDFESNSISMITMIHVIEHIEHQKLLKLMHECFRVLRHDGILLMETPSIDNIIVSTQSFYIDHTHINPIHPEAICFHIEKSGFSNVRTFFINGGPLHDASPLKITRILNGVSQDLCIIATKQKLQFENLFIENTAWQSNLKLGLTTFKAATEFDLMLESKLKTYQDKDEIKLLKNDINLLKNDINLLKSHIYLLKDELNLFKAKLKYLMFFSRIIKFIFRPLIISLKLSKKILIKILYKLFNLLIDNQYFRNVLISNKFLIIFNFFLLRVFSNSSVLSSIKSKIDKIIDHNKKFLTYNQKLELHFKKSNQSKQYKKLFSKLKK